MNFTFLQKEFEEEESEKENLLSNSKFLQSLHTHLKSLINKRTNLDVYNYVHENLKPLQNVTIIQTIKGEDFRYKILVEVKSEDEMKKEKPESHKTPPSPKICFDVHCDLSDDTSDSTKIKKPSSVSSDDISIKIWNEDIVRFGVKESSIMVKSKFQTKEIIMICYMLSFIKLAKIKNLSYLAFFSFGKIPSNKIIKKNTLLQFKGLHKCDLVICLGTAKGYLFDYENLKKNKFVGGGIYDFSSTEGRRFEEETTIIPNKYLKYREKYPNLIVNCIEVKYSMEKHVSRMDEILPEHLQKIIFSLSDMEELFEFFSVFFSIHQVRQMIKNTRDKILLNNFKEQTVNNKENGMIIEQLIDKFFNMNQKENVKKERERNIEQEKVLINYIYQMCKIESISFNEDKILDFIEREIKSFLPKENFVELKRNKEIGLFVFIPSKNYQSKANESNNQKNEKNKEKIETVLFDAHVDTVMEKMIEPVFFTEKVEVESLSISRKKPKPKKERINFCATGIDDRIYCALLLTFIRFHQFNNLNYIGLFSCAEEKGMHGARNFIKLLPKFDIKEIVVLDVCKSILNCTKHVYKKEEYPFVGGGIVIQKEYFADDCFDKYMIQSFYNYNYLESTNAKAFLESEKYKHLHIFRIGLCCVDMHEFESYGSISDAIDCLDFLEKHYEKRALKRPKFISKELIFSKFIKDSEWKCYFFRVLHEILQISGPSSKETKVLNYIQKEIKKTWPKIKINRKEKIGLWVVVPCLNDIPKQSVLFDAHVDCVQEKHIIPKYYIEDVKGKERLQVKATGLDDRLYCAMLLTMIKYLRYKTTEFVAFFSVEEEINYCGARRFAEQIPHPCDNLKQVVVLDVTYGKSKLLNIIENDSTIVGGGICPRDQPDTAYLDSCNALSYKNSKFYENVELYSQVVPVQRMHSLESYGSVSDAFENYLFFEKEYEKIVDNVSIKKKEETESDEKD